MYTFSYVILYTILYSVSDIMIFITLTYVGKLYEHSETFHLFDNSPTFYTGIIGK